MAIHPNIIKMASSLRYETLSDVQTKVIPMFLEGKNIVVEAKTGSGKTHAYLFPIFEKMDWNRSEVQAVICAPTRDLATQIFRFSSELSTSMNLKSDIRLYVGGSDREEDIRKLSQSQPQIVIGTPGRLADLIRNANVLKAHTASIFVLDEADMALEDIYLEDIDKIASIFGNTTQMTLFSATLPQDVQNFIRQYFRVYESISVMPEDVLNLSIAHYFVKTKQRDKLDVLSEVLSAINPYLCMVFTNTKENANMVGAWMKEQGFLVQTLHGDIEAKKRKQLLQSFADLKIQYLVTTDILARGIDVRGVSHIINFDLPQDPSYYIHRSGRTGRMNDNGVTISLYDLEDEKYLDVLEKRGVRGVYKEVKNKEFVDSRNRNERSRRDRAVSKTVEEAKKQVKVPTTVKPGYKKKYQNEVRKIAKKIHFEGGKKR